MWIRCICLISLMHMVDSMFSVRKDNKNKRKTLDEVISFLTKRQRLNETMKTSQIKNVLEENKRESCKYLGESISGEYSYLVINKTPVKPDNVREIDSEVVQEIEIEQRVQELLNDRKRAIERDNNPGSAYYLIEAYLKSVFGKTGEQVENGKIDLATSLLAWFSDYRNVQKLELKRYDLTCGFLRALLKILGLLEIRVVGRYEGLVIIRYREKYENGAKKANDIRNTKGDILEHQEYLREPIPHVNTVYIPGYNFAAFLAKKGLDKTKIYTVLTTWLRETKVERFIYSWKMRHKDKIYLCIVYHNLSKKEEKDVIFINVWRITHFNEDYNGELSENSFPFVGTKATTFKIYLGSFIALGVSFIGTLVRNTSAFKCKIIFMYAPDIYKFYCAIKEHYNTKNFEYGLKLNKNSLFHEDLQKCNDLYLIKHVIWDLGTKVSKTDIPFLKRLWAFNGSDRLKGLKRFTIVFPSQDSRLEAAAAFFEVFGNNNGEISGSSHKTLYATLVKYIELVS